MTAASWLATVLVALVAVSASMVALGVGMLLGRSPPRGSCGGPGGSCMCVDGGAVCQTREERT